MQLVAYYSIYNEGDFIEYSLRSIYDHVDRIVIIEGAWKETYEVNGNRRSTDDTLKIIKNFPDPDAKISLFKHNEDSQLKQRNALWPHLWSLLGLEDKILMLLVDGDEIWPENQIKKLRSTIGEERFDIEDKIVYTVDSKTFVNDFYTYTPIRFPRIWILQRDKEYDFIEPNRITVNGIDFPYKVNLDLCYLHFSYCHSPERFMEKKRERTKLHGQFSWELREGLVQKDGVEYQHFPESDLPEFMLSHPLVGKPKHRLVPKPEVIVYVEHSGIGNLILATPMLRALRNAKPDAHIYVVSWDRAYRILEGANYIDSIISVNKQKEILQLRNVEIDHLLVSPVGALDQIVQWLTKQSKKIHRVNIPQGIWAKHEAEYKMNLARKIGYRGPAPECKISLPECNRINAIMAIPYEFPNPYLCMNAAYLKAEHWRLKHWGDKKFAELIAKIHNEFPQYGFIFVGDKQDGGDADRIIAQMETKAEVLNLCGFSEDIKDTAWIIKGSRVCFGNDGGLQHIAAAVGTKTLTVFTFTNPVKNKPFGKQHEVVMVPCENRMTCQHSNWEQCGPKGCLDLPIEKVYDKLSTLLKAI